MCKVTELIQKIESELDRWTFAFEQTGARIKNDQFTFLEGQIDALYYFCQEDVALRLEARLQEVQFILNEARI